MRGVARYTGMIRNLTATVLSPWYSTVYFL